MLTTIAICVYFKNNKCSYNKSSCDVVRETDNNNNNSSKLTTRHDDLQDMRVSVFWDEAFQDQIWHIL